MIAVDEETSDEEEDVAHLPPEMDMFILEDDGYCLLRGLSTENGVIYLAIAGNGSIATVCLRTPYGGQEVSGHSPVAVLHVLCHLLLWQRCHGD